MRSNARLMAVAVLIFHVFSGLFGQISQPVFPALSGDELLDHLVADFKPTTVFKYDVARDTLYSKIYKKNGEVECVYTGHSVNLPENVDPSQAVFMGDHAWGITCEHAYPQSKGAETGKPEGDMHHLFPVRSSANSSRSNLPYGESPDDFTQKWFGPDTTLTSIPTADRDAFAEKGASVFEPREVQKGNSARAVFYFFTMYNAEAMAADSLFFEAQRPTLCAWAKNDPVDSIEWQRTWAIAAYQNGRPNPFVLDPTLPSRCFCPEILAEKAPVLNENDAKIYPNPNQGTATVSLVLEKTERVRCSIFDALGRERLLFLDEKAEAGQLEIPFFEAREGLFILKIEVGQRVFSKLVFVN